MKTHHDKIQDYTGLSKDEYEMLLVNTLMMCLSEVSKTSQHLQLLLIDKAINNWFLKQVSKVNKDFIESTKPYKNLSKSHLNISYSRFLKRIPQNYPKALIKNVNILNIHPFSIRCN